MCEDYSIPGEPWDKGKENGDRDKNDDDPFQNFHPPITGLTGHLVIQIIQRVQLAENARIPAL